MYNGSGCQWRALPREFPPRSTVRVHEANIQDPHGAVALLRDLRGRFPELGDIFADRIRRRGVPIQPNRDSTRTRDSVTPRRER